MKICIWTFALVCLVASFAVASPEWTHVVNEQEKICGSILVGDEFGTYWHGGDLPSGWKEIGHGSMNELLANPDYINLDQITVMGEAPNIRLSVSKYNIQSLLQKREWSEQLVNEEISRLDSLPDVFYNLKLTPFYNLKLTHPIKIITPRFDHLLFL